MMKPSHEQQAFSPDEIAQRNGLGRSTIFKEIKDGRLKAQKAGRRTIITRRAEKAWQDSLPSANPGASCEHENIAPEAAA
jgi:excisionase family DNA binding protein